ncbi:hypothetical protein PANT_6c00054 [Moesziomyces antarcticus T-34]|uniref:RNase III domain-containing protein n=1 Tax=Pseudozyma antarctica (strain T-34) TaxID=1151754 RepID=M9MCX0_PSEA3|nr:hypothetical protein PANT_6c00054 [Moesziomyces antarcticus T-34]
MSLPYCLASGSRRNARLALCNQAVRRPLGDRCGPILEARCVASSSRSSAQVQDEVKQDRREISKLSPEEDELKLGKRARKAVRARQRKHEERVLREARNQARAEKRAEKVRTASTIDHDAGTFTVPRSPILKVRHMLRDEEASPHRSPAQADASQEWRQQARSGDISTPTQGWNGTLFSSHISALLRGFGTLPNTPPVQAVALTGQDALPQREASSTKARNDDASESTSTAPKTSPSSMTKSERMESQARVIFRAIRDARERGMIDEDESFFYPYPEGVPPKDQHGKDTVWLNLGADPEAWGREIPTVKDRWLEVLSLGLAKEITPQSEIRRPMGTEEEADAAEQLASQDPLAFEDLVEDYDLEDHERLEQLGDSIVNMSSRLLAYQSFPDVNEGSLTRLSNYPTQNNFLALLFQECGLAARRDELRDELRGAPEVDAQDAGDGLPNDTAVKMAAKALEGAEEKEQLPSLIKRDADMFEAYAAAVFLSHGNDFNVVHAWLSHLFRPFQDQAYRFMVQRSEALARLQAARAAAANASSSSSFSFLNRGSLTPSATNIAADGLGIKSASVDPSSVSLTALFPDFMRAEKSTSPIPTHVLQGGSEAFITDEFLTVAARARRQREERLREELRLQDQRELMNMGWFRKGFLNLSKGFRQYVMGKDVVREEELRMRERIHQQRGLSEKDRERLRARERSNAGISIKSTGSKTRTKITGIQEHAPFKKE